MPNQLGKVLVLTCEATIHFSHIVRPCQEHERRPRLRLVSIPHGSHETTMMLAQVLVKQISRDVCGIHQVLDDRKPRTRTVSSLCPETPSTSRQSRCIKVGQRRGKSGARRASCTTGALALVFLRAIFSTSSKYVFQATKRANISETGYSEIVEPDDLMEIASPPTGLMG